MSVTDLATENKEIVMRIIQSPRVCVSMRYMDASKNTIVFTIGSYEEAKITVELYRNNYQSADDPCREGHIIVKKRRIGLSSDEAAKLYHLLIEAVHETDTRMRRATATAVDERSRDEQINDDLMNFARQYNIAKSVINKTITLQKVK